MLFSLEEPLKTKDDVVLLKLVMGAFNVLVMILMVMVNKRYLCCTGIICLSVTLILLTCEVPRKSLSSCKKRVLERDVLSLVSRSTGLLCLHKMKG